MRTLIACLLAAASVTAQERPVTEQERAFQQLVASRVVVTLPGMDAVAVRKDIRYSSADDPRLLADIYLPPAGNKHPIVVFIHGGGALDSPVLPKNWGPYMSWGRLAAASGFVGVTFNHRLGYPEPHLEDAAGDLRQVISYVRQHAAELNADPDRIALAAYSAGGPLLTIAMSESLPYVRGLVSFYNFLDIQRTPEHSKYESAEVVRRFSPVLYAANGTRIPPMFVVRAGKDAIPLLNESIDRFVTAALAGGVDLTLMNHPTAPHGLDFKSDDARGKEIVRGALDFLHLHLDAGSDDDFLQIESARRDAIARKDFARLETIYAGDFSGIFGSGAAIDRAFLFNVFRNDDGRLAFTTDELKVRRIGGGAAVVTGRLTARADGKIVSQQLFSHVYEKRSGTWLIVAAEGTPVREPRD